MTTPAVSVSTSAHVTVSDHAVSRAVGIVAILVAGIVVIAAVGLISGRRRV